MGLIRRDGEGVGVAAVAGEDHKDTLPVGAGYLGYIAVNKAVFIIHNEVFEIIRRKHLALPRVAQTRLLQQLPATLEGPLSCLQFQLLVSIVEGLQWTSPAFPWSAVCLHARFYS